MQVGSELILIGAALVLLSIVAGLLSSRIGAPLLLVFLGLGMLAGEDGPGGIQFDNFRLAYLAGSIALAVILFDGGLRTRYSSFRIGLWPALLLATIGVVVTAGITAVAAHLFAGFGWLQALLVGSVVGSTDAAAVFLLLHQSGMGLQRRVQATLEIESGLNDPMAIFLTIACVELLVSGANAPEAAHGWALLQEFGIQMLGGGVIGFIGGHALAAVVNRFSVAAGLYPIMALAGALFLFGGAQTLGASGFLAVYLAGLILGNRRHRAEQGINRFHDGMAWLAQIIMFLMLGMLVTPTRLIEALQPALAIAVVLMLLARPVAVWLCLAPFRFTRREIAFVSWVGLRGAVPIFLATMPVLAGLPGGRFFFDVAFVVVLASLVLQGWTVAVSARTLGLDLPPQLTSPSRTEIDLPAALGRNLNGYTVGAGARAVGQDVATLMMPPDCELISAFRDGRRLMLAEGRRLVADDYLLVIAPPDQTAALDLLFAARPAKRERDAGLFGEFEVDGDAPVSAVAALYGLQVAPDERSLDLGEMLRRRVGRVPVEGDRVRIGELELIVRTIAGDRIVKIGLELDPEHQPRRGLAAVPDRLRRWRDRLARALGRRPAGS